MGFVQLRTVWRRARPSDSARIARATKRSRPARISRLIEDFDSGAILFEKNADEPMPPASTAKLLTAEIVFRELKEGRLHLDDIFDVSEKAWRDGGAHAHGAAMFLAIHSHVRVEDLLRGLLIESGNDAAIALAEGIAGSEDNFAEMMNKRAAELGMTAFAFRQFARKIRSEPARHCARHGAPGSARHSRLSGGLPLLRREGFHLEQDTPAQSQSAPHHGYRSGWAQGGRRRGRRLRASSARRFRTNSASSSS